MGALPQLFGRMLKDEPAFYFLEKVAQPPCMLFRVEYWNTTRVWLQ